MHEEELIGPGGYMPRVTAVEVIGGYQLRLMFDDGLVREIDLEHDLWGEMFEPLKDPSYFAKVFVDPETHTIAWPNGLDLAPEVLHGDFEADRSGRPSR